MFEIKVTIEAPELAGAMMRLADAISTAPAAPSPVAPAAPEKAAALTEKPAPAKAEKPVKAPAPAKEEKPAPAPAPAAAPAAAPAPAPAQATQPEKPLDLATIARAGAGLVDQGKMPQIMELLKGYNVRAITELKQEQYQDFAKDLRTLGADI